MANDILKAAAKQMNERLGQLGPGHDEQKPPAGSSNGDMRNQIAVLNRTIANLGEDLTAVYGKVGRLEKTVAILIKKLGPSGSDSNT